MANYLSQTYLPNQPRTDENFQLLANVQLMKQQTYDYNREKIQQQLNAFGMQDVIRPQDQEYIAARLNDITNQLNGLGNRNLADQSVTNQINSSLTLAAQDPYILNAVENSSKYNNFLNQVKTTREKNPELYSATNFEDALDLAGFQDYMSGNTDSLGNLNYVPYTDVAKNINEATQKWAKDHGYRTEFTTDSSSGYVFVNTKREVLTEDEVVNFIQSSVDPSTANQLRINARQSYKGMTDTDFNNQAQQALTNENEALSSGISALQAQRANLSPDQAAIADERISEYNQRIQNNKKKISSGNYNRSVDQYTLYNRDFLKSIAQNYVKDEIVDISYDDTPLQYMKFQAEQSYRDETLKLKRMEMGLIPGAGNLALGTETFGEAEEVAKQRSQEILSDNLTEAKVNLHSILSQTNRDGYNTKNETEQRNYRNELAKTMKAENLNSAGYDEQLISTVNSYGVALDAMQTYNQTVINGVSPLISGAYNDIALSKSGQLNKDNLGLTMPTVAKYAKAGTSFENITNPQDKQLIKYELASNFLQYDSSLTDEQREALSVYSNNLSRQKVNSSETKRKMATMKLQNADDSGLITSYGKMVTNSIASLWTDFSGVVGGAIASPFRSREEDLDAAREVFQKSENYDRTAYINGARVGNLARNYFGGQDTNVTELEGFDVSSGRDLNNSFSTGLTSVVNTANAVADKGVPTISQKKAYSFSTEDKVQKQTANQLGIIIQAQFPEGSIPSNTNSYTLERAADGLYTIHYNTGTGKNTERTSVTGVPFQNLPESVRNTFGNERSNWANSMNNENAVKKDFTYRLPVNASERADRITAYRDNYRGALTDESYFKVLQNPAQTQFATPTEMVQNVIKKYGQQFYNSNKQEIDRIVTSSYNTNVKVAPGYGFIASITNTDTNSPQVLNTIVMPGDYNQVNAVDTSMRAVVDAMSTQIAELYARYQ